MTPGDEAKRHRCEIDYVLAMRGKAERNQYLALVAKARGQAAADRLRDAAMAAWKRQTNSVPDAGGNDSGAGVSPTLEG